MNDIVKSEIYNDIINDVSMFVEDLIYFDELNKIMHFYDIEIDFVTSLIINNDKNVKKYIFYNKESSSFQIKGEEIELFMEKFEKIVYEILNEKLWEML